MRVGQGAANSKMGYLGVSLILASVVILCLRPPKWLPGYFGILKQRLHNSTSPRSALPEEKEPEKNGSSKTIPSAHDFLQAQEGRPPEVGATDAAGVASVQATEAGLNRATMLPSLPAVSLRRIDHRPQVEEEAEHGEQTTPKASATVGPGPVPTFSLSDLASSSAAPLPATVTVAPTDSASAASLMPPPPRPPTLNRLHGQTQTPAPSPATYPSSRSLPIPNRGGSAFSSGTSLAPPPTHSAKPAKASRQVVLQPGHSPLDWARLSGSPHVGLRGLPPGTPYLRVTPSRLREQNGRRGRDAWMALSGRVYNVTPYLPFHPGGPGELLRGAGRDGTKLFGEVHPWVNYEGMLAACLVGILVPEEEAAAVRSDMEQMD